MTFVKLIKYACVQIHLDEICNFSVSIIGQRGRLGNHPHQTGTTTQMRKTLHSYLKF